MLSIIPAAFAMALIYDPAEVIYFTDLPAKHKKDNQQKRQVNRKFNNHTAERSHVVLRTIIDTVLRFSKISTNIIILWPRPKAQKLTIPFM